MKKNQFKSLTILIEQEEFTLIELLNIFTQDFNYNLNNGKLHFKINMLKLAMRE